MANPRTVHMIVEWLEYEDPMGDWNWNREIIEALAAHIDRYMESEAAAVLGSRTSPRKAKSSADNGRKGGRPKKKAAEE